MGCIPSYNFELMVINLINVLSLFYEEVVFRDEISCLQFLSSSEKERNKENVININNWGRKTID